MKAKFYVELNYKDDSGMGFEVCIDARACEIYATLSMIVRGTLMASMAKRATAYNDQGFDVISFTREYESYE